MKKIVLLVLVATVVVLTVLSGNMKALSSIGDVVALEGIAKVQHNGDSKWNELKLNDQVFLMDNFKTEKNSGLKIILDDDTVLTLASETELKIDEHMYTPEKESTSVISLFTGSVRSAVGKLFGAKSKYEVKTPTAVSGVKGTDFIVSHNRKTGESAFTAVKHSVWVRGNTQKKGDEIVLKEGWTTRVGKGKPPENPWKVDDDEWMGILFDVTSFGIPANTADKQGPPGRDFNPSGDNIGKLLGMGNPQEDIIDEIPEGEILPEPVEPDVPFDPQY